MRSFTNYYSGYQMKKKDMERHKARVGKRIGSCRDLVGKSEENKPLARQRIT
jgi:hypothetical protein